MLKKENAQEAFYNFLKMEYNDTDLELYLASVKLQETPQDQQPQFASDVYEKFITNGSGKGIGQQERTDATQKLWDNGLGRDDGMRVDPNFAYKQVIEQANETLKMLSLDSFPRFMKTKECKAVMQSLQQSDGQLAKLLQDAENKTPEDADDWLNMFVSVAEALPACTCYVYSYGCRLTLLFYCCCIRNPQSYSYSFSSIMLFFLK